MDTPVKLAVVVGALLAGTGVFYHYVVFLPGVERERASSIERQKAEERDRDEKRQFAYRLCIERAREVYDANWAQACTSVAAATDLAYKNCLLDKAVMTNQFLGAAYCKRTYGSTDSSPSCSLPGNRAESINAQHQRAQEKCSIEARLGL